MYRRIITLTLVTLLLTSCRLFPTPITPAPDPDFTRVDYDALPMEVKDWVNNSRTMHIAHSKVAEGRRYIMASYGEQPTGGFGIHIEDVEIGSNKIIVTIRHTDPAPNQNVTDALTYPRDIVHIGNMDLPIEYVAIGDREYIPILVGIDELPEIMAESAFIKIFSPSPGCNVPGTFTVEGVANVFEGTVNYILRAADGQVLLESHTMAGMGDWYFFEEDMEIPEEVDTFTLELFTYSADDGRVIHLVDFPLQREQAGD